MRCIARALYSNLLQWFTVPQQKSSSQNFDVRSLTHHNDLQPINQLPVETLASIISMVQDDVIALFPPATPGELRNANLWLGATQVCHYWRQCSLLFPLLWQNITLGPDNQDDGRLGTLLLLNSKSVPFHFNFVMKPKTAQDYFSPHPTPLHVFFQNLRDNSYRIVALHAWSAHHIQTGIWDFLDRPLPSLRSLHLDLKAANFGEGAEATPTLPIILGGQTSHLKLLSLSNVGSWSSNTFSELTHLSLRNQEDCWRPSLSQFLNSIDALPLLQVLCLYRAGPILTLPMSTPTRTVTLLALRRIEIGCVYQPEVEVPCQLLQYLDMPMNVTIVVSSQAMFRSAAIFRHHLPPTAYMSKITSCDIRMTSGQYLVLHEHTFVISSMISLEACFLLLSPLRDITDIIVNRPFSLPNNHLRRTVLPAFPALRSIQIKFPSDYASIIEALQGRHHPPTCIPFAQLLVCDLGFDLGAFKPASRAIIRPYQEAGVTVVQRQGLGTSYQVIVCPYVDSASRWRRRLPFEK